MFTTHLPPEVDVRTHLATDLEHARATLIQAHMDVGRRDAPETQERLAAARKRIDGLLDLFLALGMTP